MAPPSFNVVIVGAGISGIAAAKFYLDVHPDCRLIILEKDTCLGGVWSQRRSYPTSWTQWTVGMAEFSDKPMKPPPTEDTFYDFFKSKHTTQYLNDFVDWYKCAGRTLRSRIQFGAKVRNIQKLEGGWRIYCEDDGEDNEKIFHTSKLMIATGLFSIPKFPDLSGQEKFACPILHQENYGESSVLSSDDIRRVTVLGGGKFAADMVYDCVKAGKEVSWIIGTDPGFFISPKGKGPYKNAFALSSTRVFASLTPSIYNQSTWWTRFLHSSEPGQKFVSKVWSHIDKKNREEVKFQGKEFPECFQKLNPKKPLFWQNGSSALINKPDFLNTISKAVSIHTDDIQSLSQGRIHFQNGTEIPTDALLCSTGFSPSPTFFDPKLLYSLGLPSPLSIAPLEDIEKWTTLETEADTEILRKFPMLAHPPTTNHMIQKTPSPEIPITPFRLYNGIAPLRDDSIVFLGQVLVGNHFLTSEIQAIWATAYLDKKLEALPELAEREREVARGRAWCRRRYLGVGEVGNLAVWEGVGYGDSLLREVGLGTWRKGWVRERFGVVGPRDLRGLREEYVKKFPELGVLGLGLGLGGK